MIHWLSRLIGCFGVTPRGWRLGFMKRLWSYRSTGWLSRGLVLKEATLTYIISHDTIPFKTLSRTGLETRYEVFRRPWRGRGLRSQLLVRLAYATVTHRNQRYLAIYECYRRRGMKHWQAILRVAIRILRDVRRLAMEAQEAGQAPA
jgi:hypothetical protein